MPYVQEQMWQVHVWVVDQTTGQNRSLGIWDSFEGGDVDSDARTYRPGGMQASVALSSPAQTSDVTISRGYQTGDIGTETFLHQHIGHPIEITKTAMDVLTTRPVSRGLQYRGIIKSVRTPTHDSDGDRVTRLQIVAVINGTPTEA